MGLSIILRPEGGTRTQFKGFAPLSLPGFGGGERGGGGMRGPARARLFIKIFRDCPLRQARGLPGLPSQDKSRRIGGWSPECVLGERHGRSNRSA